MARYGPYYRRAEGSIAKVLGVLFIFIGAYALADLYGIFTIEIFTSKYVLIACAIGSILGGLFMLGRNRRTSMY